MTKLQLLMLLGATFFCINSFAQNSPLAIWGTGLNGTTFQQTAIYSDTDYGLLIEAPKDAADNRLNISFNWRGAGVTAPLFIQGSTLNVGIGTSVPLTNLHIGNSNNGGIRIGDANDIGNISVALGAQTIQYNLDFSGYRDISPDQIGARISALRFNSYENNNALRQSTGLAFYTNPTGFNSGTTDLYERMRISPLGNVGIGTSTPLANLHIGNLNNGGIRIGAANDIGNVSVALGAQTVQYNLDFSGYRDISPDQIGARISALRFNSYENNNALRQTTGLAFYTNPTGSNSGTTDLLERIRITPDGNVGIGTTNPDSKLTVAGDIHSREVKVTVDAGTGPDYVFEPTYQLPTLTEIENYIKINKHLPEVPSAKEMETNGINLSEMNMLLLKKVEELTLYLIEVQKNSIDQQKQIAEQSKEIEFLKLKIK